MKIIQVEKTIEYIVSNFRNEDLYFVKIQLNLNKEIRSASMYSVNRVMVKDLQKYVDDPNIILVKICTETDEEVLDSPTEE